MIFDTLKFNDALLKDFLAVRLDMLPVEKVAMFERANQNVRAFTVYPSRDAEIDAMLISKKIKTRAKERIQS